MELTGRESEAVSSEDLVVDHVDVEAEVELTDSRLRDCRNFRGKGKAPLSPRNASTPLIPIFQSPWILKLEEDLLGL